MKGRSWSVLGAVIGVAMAAGHISYLAGAARSLADDAQRIVGTAGARVITAAGHHGAPARAVLGVTAVLAVLVPGITALLLVVAARGARVIRTILAVLLAAVGVASFAYQSAGHSLGVMFLALAVAGAALALTGPLVILPLCALAGLIGGEFLPRLLAAHSTLPNAPVSELHRAIYRTAGMPLALRVGVLVVAALPFAAATRQVLKV